MLPLSSWGIAWWIARVWIILSRTRAELDWSPQSFELSPDKMTGSGTGWNPSLPSSSRATNRLGFLRMQLETGLVSLKWLRQRDIYICKCTLDSVMKFL